MHIYSNSSNENKYKIEKIQNEALRLCTDALKSTPVCSLQHACNKMPPNVRYLQLCLFYRAHLLPISKHPALSVIQDSWFDWFPGWLLTNHFFSGNLNVHKLYEPYNPLWSMPSCQIDLSLCDLANENPEVAKQNFLHVDTNNNDYLLFYTDGSKTDFGTSSSFYIHWFDVRRVIKLNANASIFTAELHAIFKALYWISQNWYAKNLIICDSLSMGCRV